MKLFLIFAVLVVLTQQIDWNDANNAVEQAIKGGVFPGCVLAVVNHTKVIYKSAYGRLYARNDLFAPLMSADMMFDINWLTQVIGINSLFMRLSDEGFIKISQKVYSFISAFNNNGKGNITIQNLMLHNSGLPSDWTGQIPDNQTQFYKQLDNMKLEFKVEEKFKYSELGYLVLGQLLSKYTNKTLEDALFQVLVQSGARNITYNPKTSLDKIAPGGFYKGKGLAHGKSFNKYVRVLNGMAGNAGLFSTIDNICTYIQLILNKGKFPGGSRIYSQDIVRIFTQKVTIRGYNNTQAHGWETVPLVNPPCGKKFSPYSFGLSDPSGSYVWGDMTKGIAIVLLANGKIYGSRQDPSIFQGKISDAIMTALGY